METEDLFQIMKPGPLPEPTNCIGLFRTMKRDKLIEVHYLTNGLFAEVEFEGQIYQIEIKPKDAKC